MRAPGFRLAPVAGSLSHADRHCRLPPHKATEGSRSRPGGTGYGQQGGPIIAEPVTGHPSAATTCAQNPAPPREVLSRRPGVALAGGFHAGAERTGMVNVNVEPCPIWLLTQIRPPCSSTNFRDSASPSPVPSTFLSAVPTWRNSSNTAS
jgi:hypothetical protein